MDHFPIIIPGTAIPQGSKSVTRTGVMYEANPKLREWRTHCAAVLTAWTGTWFGAWEPYDGPLRVEVTFYLPKPQRPRAGACCRWPRGCRPQSYSRQLNRRSACA